LRMRFLPVNVLAMATPQSKSEPLNAGR